MSSESSNKVALKDIILSIPNNQKKSLMLLTDINKDTNSYHNIRNVLFNEV